MESIITKIALDVHLTKSERDAVRKLLDRKGFEVLRDAQLIVKVEMKIEEKKP